jgi:uncharacterized repeat protein (TIGR03803 family)
MQNHSSLFLAGASLWAFGVGVGSARAASGPDNFSGNQGTIKVISYFTQGWGAPGPLTEISPGTFTGLALIGGTPNPHAFTLTNKGTLSSVYTFPTASIPFPWEIQGVNGQVYGSLGTPFQNFSIGVGGNLTYYPQVLANTPVFSVQVPSGNLYGTGYNFAIQANCVFVRMTLNGAVTVLHNFTAQEGDPYGRPILASDGNFYGISGTGSGIGGISGMVYRMTPGRKLTILATYPDGRKDYAPGAYPESLVEVGNGNLFGTAAFGGSNRAGVIFEISPTGGYKVIHEFTDWKVGVPTVMVLATDGNLYGVADGEPQLGGGDSLFRVTPAGEFQTIYDLATSGPGLCPCYLVQGSDGKLYGTSQNGGAAGGGAAWAWDLGLPKPLPALTGLQPLSGAVGSSVLVYGNNLLGPVSVSFNGTPATAFKGVSANYISATVPAGATSGPVTVTTPNGAATSPGSFTVQ